MIPCFRTPFAIFIVCCSFWPMSGQAKESLHASLGVTSNYVWRGLSQTDGSAAVSGGLEFVSENNLYVGSWISNTKQGTKGVDSSEVDLYLGVSGVNKGTGYDLGFIYYSYPQSEDLNFEEYYIALMVEDFTIKMSDSYDTGNYLEANYRAKLKINTKRDAAVSFHLGRYIRDEGENYADGSVSLHVDELSLTISDTDLSNSDPQNKSVKFFVSWEQMFDF